MKNKEFNDLKQGFQDAINFVKNKDVSKVEIESFTVKRSKKNN